MDTPVVDETLPNDRSDFELQWTPDESKSYCPRVSSHFQDDSNPGSGLYTAIQEQLG